MAASQRRGCVDVDDHTEIFICLPAHRSVGLHPRKQKMIFHPPVLTGRTYDSRSWQQQEHTFYYSSDNRASHTTMIEPIPSNVRLNIMGHEEIAQEFCNLPNHQRNFRKNCRMQGCNSHKLIHMHRHFVNLR